MVEPPTPHHELLGSLDPAGLLAAAQDVAARVPADARLAKNQVGNLTVLVDRTYAGWLDMRTGELHLFDSKT